MYRASLFTPRQTHSRDRRKNARQVVVVCRRRNSSHVRRQSDSDSHHHRPAATSHNNNWSDLSTLFDKLGASSNARGDMRRFARGGGNGDARSLGRVIGVCRDFRATASTPMCTGYVVDLGRHVETLTPVAESEELGGSCC